ncbi:tyrosine-type recombinase/integrase [Bradyrhizobium sp. 166]|uniref:tyrosine-type recombinase/integrase n=1 Tax=Bradyrhizobium sp. 166 TaxID=2782638 RepID=UPI001FFB0602|nr:site-specific integrase [Bradyrhizobium sp. 166]MCK1607241.1 tyrosine-type recombinase/integrase [Bradyrhizobium sp. 166]
MARDYGKLKAKQVDYLTKRGLYGDGGGLYLQVAKGGSRSWLFRFKANGRSRWHGLGSARDVSLADARIKAGDARRLRLSGGDPIEAKRTAKATARIEAAKAITFGAAAKRFIKANAPGWKNAKHAAQWQMTLLGIDQDGKPTTHDYCKTIRDLPMSSIDTTLVLRIIEPIWAVKTETANRIRGRIEAVIDAAKSKGEFNGENPARWKAHLDNLLPATSKVRKVRNHPALPYQQLPAFMRELREREGVAAAALEFQILTAVRPGNAVAAKKDQIDWQAAVWKIPAALMKSDVEHKVPLSQAALDVLERMEALNAGSEYIFPNSKGKPLSDASTAAVIDRLNEHERRWVDPKVDREIVPHGFRSSFRDWAAEHGYDDAVAEAALAHKVSDGVIAAYKRTTFFELRKQMMKGWAEYCGRPVTGEKNVVPLRAQK